MPKLTSGETKKVTLRLFKGDTEALEEFYPELGYNHVIRTLVHAHVKKLREAQNRVLSEKGKKGVPAHERDAIDNLLDHVELSARASERESD